MSDLKKEASQWERELEEKHMSGIVFEFPDGTGGSDSMEDDSVLLVSKEAMKKAGFQIDQWRGIWRIRQASP